MVVCACTARVLALAYRDTSIKTQAEAETADLKHLETDITLVALLGIQDPLRPEVVPALKQCQRAGITVRMLTGAPALLSLLWLEVHAAHF